MVDSEKQNNFAIKGLSLIDVSSEDDCLINSPLCDPINPQSSEKGSQTKTVRFAMDPDNVEISLGSLEEAGKVKERPGSSEQDKRKDGKYNLRKSLAWDSAFFTSAGFLEPEELSSMLGGNKKGQVHTLPGIQEDVNKSYDSLTTLDSETLTLESLEADLFEDIRASIQKSNKASNTANSSGKKELKTTDTQTVSSLKVEFTAQDKMRQKAAPKKPNIGVKDSGRTLKQVPVRPQISQVRSSGRTPNGSMLYHPGVPSGLPKIGAKSTSPSGISNKVKNGKLEPVRTLTAIQSPEVDVKKTSSAVKSRSSLTIKKSPNAAIKVPSASRHRKSNPGISPKLQNKSSPRTGRESYSRAQGIGSAGKIVGPGFPEQVVRLGGMDVARIKDTKIVPLDGVPETTANLASKSDVQNTNASKEAAENETYSSN
ncbi:uncharacterized protein LOC111311874 isoform X1 [Durio zibethinus]|uniref:Uncharacterized protein LOC111311874 isoform X1 n=1 Tax=Durio zibethinus TaxID=66656 RepID=A0A6P6ARG1_DURZI|nr:uncharacterized protein LOC111311874 isoform X1 [Durio zibethinus]